jgi:hypothetical protein
MADAQWRAGVAARYPGLLADLGVVRDAVLGQRYGCSGEYIRQVRQRVGVDRVPRGSGSLANAIRARLSPDATSDEIMAATGSARRYVNAQAKQAGVTLRRIPVSRGKAGTQLRLILDALQAQPTVRACDLVPPGELRKSINAGLHWLYKIGAVERVSYGVYRAVDLERVFTVPRVRK